MIKAHIKLGIEKNLFQFDKEVLLKGKKKTQQLNHT